MDGGDAIRTDRGAIREDEVVRRIRWMLSLAPAERLFVLQHRPELLFDIDELDTRTPGRR